MAGIVDSTGVEKSLSEKLQVSENTGSACAPTSTSSAENLIRVEQYAKTDESIGKVRFLFWFLQGSLYVWIGPEDAPATMPHLVMGGTSKHAPGPLATSVVSYSGDDEMSQNIAKRCALKTGQVVFVTCTLKDKADQSVSVFVAKEIISKIKEAT